MNIQAQPGAFGSPHPSNLPLLFLVFTFLVSSGLAGQFHVTPAATAGGNGTLASPWQLQSALTQTAAVHPGDTIWVHGGSYINPTNGQDHVAWMSTISGTAAQPVIVSAYPGEHPSLDGANSQQNDILRVVGSNVWFIGLEIFSSSVNRYSPSGGSFPPSSEIDRGICVSITQDQAIAGVKLINCILHDGFVGYGNTSATSTSAELYGCLLYNNGWFASDRNHGHDVYIQNVAGNIRTQNNNIIWGAFENNVQAYGTRNTDDFSFDSNVIFEPGGDNGDGGGLLIGGAQVSNNAIVTNNYFYENAQIRVLDLGWNPYGAGLNNATVTGNYVGGGEIYFQGPITNSTITGDTIYYTFLQGASTTDYPNNVWMSTKPKGVKVVVIPNKYEAGRANIAVYNWDKNASVAVDLSGTFKTGDTYTIVDAQNPSVVVASGTYAGPVSIPMTGLVAVNPIGQGTRTHTAPEFGAFIATGGSGLVIVATPPTVATGAASNVTFAGALVKGTVNPNGFSTSYHFEYGTTTAYGSVATSANAGSGTGAVSVNARLGGLSASTTYHYRLVAANSAGTVSGGDQTFTTAIAPPPPTVTTSPATNVTSRGALLNGSVNPNGTSATYHFEYGTTTSYGTSTSAASAGSGTAAVSVSAQISGLAASTLYHFRLVASDSGGSANGNDQTFTTGSGPAPPTVTTSPATNVSTGSAQLNGTVNPNGISATYHFDYGTTTSYGSSTSSAGAGSGSTALSVSAQVSGLASSTLYHFRLVATDSAGTVNGGDQTFTTASVQVPPAVTTSAASGVTPSAAQLNGTVNPNGLSTSYHFEYGTTTSYGSSTTSAGAGSGTAAVSVNSQASGLAASTLYHFRLVASSSAGSANGIDQTFTTAAAPVAPSVTTSAATGVTSGAATLNGSVNPNGSSATYHFEYGFDASYGSSTQSTGAGSGSSPQNVSAALSGLSSGTIYHFRLVAANAGGTTNGGDLTFTTVAAPPPPSAPTVATSAATNITLSGAQLNGTVNPNGQSTTYHFEYGTTSAYGTSTATANAGSGSSAVTVDAMLTGLAQGTVYHFRIVATSSAGTSNGNDRTVTIGTAPPGSVPPQATTAGASAVSTNGAQLNGLVNPEGFATTYSFDYGPTTDYGSSTEAGEAGSGSSILAVSAVISGLNPAAVYHFRVVATNGGGTVTGRDTTFQTGEIPVVAGINDVAVLRQNFPNPFNPSTSVEYYLPSAGAVSLKIYSTLGITVATLATGYQAAGRHSAVWDARGCVSGVYFCVLSAGGVISTRRMLLVK